MYSVSGFLYDYVTKNELMSFSKRGESCVTFVAVAQVSGVLYISYDLDPSSFTASTSFANLVV